MPTIAEPFAHGSSLIHRLDARFRLASAMMVTIPAALFQNINAALIAFIVGALLVFSAQLPLAKVFKRLLAVNFFIGFLWLFLPFSTPGELLATVGPLTATHEGVALATLITVKSNAVVLSLMTLMGTIPVQDLGPAMQRLRVPNKLCHILLFTYRYIFVIYQEYTTMRRAMSARGFRPKTDRHTYQTYAWLVGMILVKSWDRAERVHGAMHCRGFRGRFYSLTEFKASTKDTLFLAASLLLAAGLISLEVMYRMHS